MTSIHPTDKANDHLVTPKYITDALGPFDLDPCAGADTNIATANYAKDRGYNGLVIQWRGLVWCNPPFSQKTLWITRMIEHNNGILLLPERGSAPWFGPLAAAAGHYFVMGEKINFIGGSSSSNIGSCFFPFGCEARSRLFNSDLPGHMVRVLSFHSRQSSSISGKNRYNE